MIRLKNIGISFETEILISKNLSDLKTLNISMPSVGSTGSVKYKFKDGINLSEKEIEELKSSIKTILTTTFLTFDNMIFRIMDDYGLEVDKK
jgi:hypothetical protein